MDHWKVDKPMDLRAQLRNQHTHCNKPFGETKGTESWAGELEIGKGQGLICEKWGGGCWQCPSPTCTHYPRDLAAWPLALMGVGITRARVRWKTKGDSRAPPNFHPPGPWAGQGRLLPDKGSKWKTGTREFPARQGKMRGEKGKAEPWG